MEKKIVVSTKIKENQDYKGEEEVIELTIDLANLTQQDMEDLAVDSLVIKWATKTRKLGQSGIRALKGKDTYIAQKPGVRTYAKVMSPEEIMKAVLKDPNLLKQILEAQARLSE